MPKKSPIKAKKSVKKEIKQEDYQARVKIMGRFYEASGKSALEAILNLKTGSNAKGVALLSVSKGAFKREKVLASPQVFRLFGASPSMKAIAIKNLSLIFDF